MAYDLFIKRRIEEIEEKITSYKDPIERLYLWFEFIKDFTQEAHIMFDKQYEELVKLTREYVDTPDPVAREAFKKQIISCTHEIDRFNKYMKAIPKIQLRLEQDVCNLEAN